MEALVVVLEDPDLRLNLAQGLFQAEHIRREGGGGWRRLFLFRFGLAGLGVSDLALERGDLPRQQDDVRVLLAELSAEACQVLFQPGEAELRALRGGGWPTRHPGWGGEERFGLCQLARQRLPAFRGPCLSVGVQPNLRVQSFEGGEIGLHLLRQLTQIAALELAHPLLLIVEPLLRFLELDLEKLRGAGRLTLTCLQVLLDIEGRERVRNQRDRARLTPLVTDREGHRGLACALQLDALELELDVPAHTLDDFLGWDLRP